MSDRRTVARALSIAVFCLIWSSAGLAHASIVRLNNVTGSNNGADNTLPATWSSPTSTSAGNLLVAVVAVRGGTGTTITPPAGQSWVLAKRSDNGTNVSVAVYYIKNAPVQSGLQTWFVSGNAKGTLMLLEYDGIDPTAPLDLTASSFGTGTAANTGTGVPVSDAAELAVGAVTSVDTPTMSAPTGGFTRISTNSSTGGNGTTRNRTEVYEDLFTGAIVPDATITMNETQAWAGVLVTFKASSLYWIGSAAGTFSDAARWSTRSGGPNNSPAPTTGDQVAFDGNGTGSCSIAANTVVDAIELRSGYTGTVTLGATRTLQLTHDLTVEAGTFTAGGGAITTNGSGSYTGNVNVTGGTLNGNGSAVTTQDLIVSSGTYNTGTGTLTVRRNLTMTGGTVATGGTATISSSSGTGAISGGTFRNASAGTSTFTRALALSGTGAITLTAGTIATSAAVTMAGTATFTGASGTTTNFNSTLGMTGGTLTTAGGAFNLNDDVTISAGTYNNTGSSTTTIASGDTLALSGTGAVSVATGTFRPRGPVTLAGSATYTGATSTTHTFESTLGLTGGTFDLNGGSITLTGAATVGGGTYLATGTNTFSSTLAVSAGTFDADGGTVNVAGQVTIGGGTYRATGATSTFSRATAPALSVTSGTIDAYGGTLSVPSSTVTISGGTFQTTTGTATFGSTVTISGTGTYDALGGSSTAAGLVTVSGGTYKIGSSATGQTMSNGMTISGGTLDGSSSTGALKIAATKVLTVSSGTLQTSTGVTTGPIFNVSGAGTYTFTISGGTVSLNGGKIVGVSNTAGVNIASAATIAQLDYVDFANIPATNPGTTQYLLSINETSLDLRSTGCKFDYNPATFTNLKTVRLTDSGTGTDVRAWFQLKDAATNGAAAGDAYDADEDTAPDDGVGDTGNKAVVYWSYAVATDTAGAIQGFPTAAFDWNTYAFYATYAVFNDIAGASTADRIYVRDTNGLPVSSYDVANTDGNIVGTPLWTTESSAHILYVATSTGKIYRLVDTAGTLALPASGNWTAAFTNATVTSITSPLVDDGTNLYFGGKNGTNNRVFGVSKSAKTLVKNVAASAAVSAAPSWKISGGVTYLFVGSATTGAQAYIYRINMVPSGTVDATCLQATTSIGSSTRLVSNILYAGDGSAKLHAIDAMNFGVGAFINKSGFPYQDSNVARHSAVTVGAIQGTPWVESSISRIFYGDNDGHLYQLTTAGALAANYPIKLTTANQIRTSPLYMAGVILVGDSGGNVYYVDAKNASSAPAVFYTTTLSGAVSSISYNNNVGKFMVGTAAGLLEMLPVKADPTPTFVY